MENYTEDIGVGGPPRPTEVTFETSPQINEWAGAMAKAMGEIGPPSRVYEVEVKNRDGRFLYKYAYADLAQCWSAVRPALADNDLACNQFPVRVGDPTEGMWSILTFITHSSGQWVKSRVEFKINRGKDKAEFFDPDDPQKVGSCITYYCRYCLEAIFGLYPPGSDDDGSTASFQGQDKEATIKDKRRGNSGSGRSNSGGRTYGNGKPKDMGERDVWTDETKQEFGDVLDGKNALKENGDKPKPPQEAMELFDLLEPKMKSVDQRQATLMGILQKTEGIPDDAQWTSAWFAENKVTKKQWGTMKKAVEHFLETIISPDELKARDEEAKEKQRQERAEAREKNKYDKEKREGKAGQDRIPSTW